MTGNLQVITPAVVTLTPLGHGHLMPALNAQEGERAGWRYVEFFTASIRIPHTRRDYESLQKIHSAPSMKQQAVGCNAARHCTTCICLTPRPGQALADRVEDCLM